ncbi:MAG: hypothetical protein HY726_06845 [Candidatus Rokubacteria bacterium]|nr:hypothetical protein [Candidatus Rokubacteria bacterium]
MRIAVGVVVLYGLGVGPLGLAPREVPAQPAAQDRLYVAAQDKLLVLDPASLRVVKTVTVPGSMGPSGVATADGRRLYVSNSARRGVMVIDTATHEIIELVSVGINPVGPMLLSPDGRTVWVMSEEAVSVIDATTHRLLARVPVDDGVSGGMTFAPIGDSWRAYVTNPKEHSVLVIDAEKFGVVARIPVGTRPWRGVVYSKLSRKVYVANTGSQDLSVVDVATNTVAKTLPLPRPGFNSIAITPDGRFLFLDSRYSRKGGDSQLVVDASTDLLVATIDVRPTGTSSPANPSRLVFTQDSRLGLSIHKTSPHVTVIDVPGLRILKTIELKPLSDKVLYRCSVTLAPDGKTAYVTSAVEETITVIDVATLAVRAVVRTHAPTCGMHYVQRR